MGSGASKSSSTKYASVAFDGEGSRSASKLPPTSPVEDDGPKAESELPAGKHVAAEPIVREVSVGSAHKSASTGSKETQAVPEVSVGGFQKNASKEPQAQHANTSTGNKEPQAAHMPPTGAHASTGNKEPQAARMPPTGALVVCVSVDSTWEDIGQGFANQLRGKLRESSRILSCYEEVRVMLSVLKRGASAPHCAVMIPLLTPDLLLTPDGVASLRGTLRLRAMGLGPELLPLIHVAAFGAKPDALARALNAPSGQLLREAASPGSWGRLDAAAAAVGTGFVTAVCWATGRVEALMAKDAAAEVGDTAGPPVPGSRNVILVVRGPAEVFDAQGPAAREAFDASKGYGRGQGDGGASGRALRPALRHKQVEPNRDKLDSTRRRPSSEFRNSSNSIRPGMDTTILWGSTKWADAMREVLGAPVVSAATPQPAMPDQSQEDTSSRLAPVAAAAGGGVFGGSLPPLPETDEPPIPTWSGNNGKGPVLPPAPDRPPKKPWELTAQGHDRRLNPWRPREPLAEKESAFSMDTAIFDTLRESNVHVLKVHAGRSGSQTAPPTPRGGHGERDDDVDLESTRFRWQKGLRSTALSPRAMRRPSSSSQGGESPRKSFQHTAESPRKSFGKSFHGTAESPRKSFQGTASVFAGTCRTWDPSASWSGAFPAGGSGSRAMHMTRSFTTSFAEGFREGEADAIVEES